MAVSKKRSNGSGSIYKRGDNFYLQYMQIGRKKKKHYPEKFSGQSHPGTP